MSKLQLLLVMLIQCSSSKYFLQAAASANCSLKRLATPPLSDQAYEFVLNVQLLQQQSDEQPSANTETAFDAELAAMVRQELNLSSWQRADELLALVNQTRSLNLKRSLYKALWHELKHGPEIYNPFHIADFYLKAVQEPYLPASLRYEIRLALIARSAQIIEATFHTTARVNFPLVTNLLQHLTQLGNAIFSEIISAVYDAIALLEDPRDTALRLSNFSFNIDQLANANIKLLERKEVANNQLARQQVALNLEQLLTQADFEGLNKTIRARIYAELPGSMRTLYTAQKICLSNATESDAYIYECPQTYLMCSNAHDAKKAAFYVLRTHSSNGSGDKFAFYSAYWRNRYIKLEPNNGGATTVASNAITKNVYSRESIDWWQVRFFDNLVAIYSGQYVLCGAHWDGDEHHVYTRNLQDLELYLNECLWQIEDCSDGV